MARRETGVSGLSEMLETLKNLPPELGSKGGGPTRSALFQAAKIWKERAAELAPVSAEDTDGVRLKDNIIMKRDPRPNLAEYSERYAVTYNNKAFWGGFVELGTSKQPAQSFLRATFDEKGDEALQVFATTFRRRLDAAVKKAKAS